VHDSCEPPPPPNPRKGGSSASAPADDGPADGADCVDNDSGFRRMNGGHSCAAAESHCAKGTFGFHTVRKYCPATCGMCVPSPGAGPAWANATEPLVDRTIEVFSVPFSALGGKDLVGDVVLAEGPAGAGCAPGGAERNASCVVAAHRVLLVARMPQVYTLAFYDYEDLNAPFKKHGVDGFAYHIKYEFAVMDFHMKTVSARNLLTAMPVIGLCTSLFLHPVIALFSVLGVASIDLVLFGVMALHGTPLNVITLLSLLIALGLAIDYSCHFGHAYEHSPAKTRVGKIRYAMRTVGMSILNAGLSTLLGTFFIAFSRSALFRIFFLFVWGTIALGLICGLVVMPVALATWGPVGQGAPAAKKEGIISPRIVKNGSSTAVVGRSEGNGGFVRLDEVEDGAPGAAPADDTDAADAEAGAAEANGCRSRVGSSAPSSSSAGHEGGAAELR